MKSLPKYRITGLALAVIFTLFNVGLPIVVASCPMMDDKGAACCAKNEDLSPGVAKITRSIDRSCCITKYASDRNKTEFVQEHVKRLDLLKFFVVSIASAEPLTEIADQKFLITLTASPPRSVDIPILVSSLLI